MSSNYSFTSIHGHTFFFYYNTLYLLLFEEMKCPPPTGLCNGYLVCSNDNSYEFESTCHPVCNDGYDTDQAKSLSCNGTHWIGVIQPCVGKLKHVLGILISMAYMSNNVIQCGRGIRLSSLFSFVCRFLQFCIDGLDNCWLCYF